MSILNWIAPDAPADAFPPVDQALKEPEGLVASGGDLSRVRLLAAYSRGIFPWYDAGQPVLWWSPDPRAFLYADQLRISRSLRKTLKRAQFDLSFDQDFQGVVRACAAPRRNQQETWIIPEMIAAYCDLHDSGHAHSLELRIDGVLAGGIYGVTLGRMFYAESMFSRVSDASKIALAGLVWQLAEWGFPGIDCQLPSPHLESMGCVSIPRTEFIKINNAFRTLAPPSRWTFDPLLIARHLAAPRKPAKA